MSDTPRTDGTEPYGPPYNETPVIHVPKAFARQLERELNAWKTCAEAFYNLDHNAGFEMYEKLKGVKP